MTRTVVLTASVVLLSWVSGCKEEPPATPPEVPKAGPAVDPGPAPAGQSEPGAGAEKATPADEPVSFNETQTGELQLTAFAEPEKAEAVEVKVIDWKATEKLIASHKGKVVVVDMWSLACAPCIREFPNLVKLHNDKGDQVACISVSTDYAGIKSKPAESYKPKVLEFLTKQNATFDNVLCSVDSETLFDTLSLASIPAVYVYGKDGKLAQRFAGEEVHYDKEVLPLVETLLAK